MTNIGVNITNRIVNHAFHLIFNVWFYRMVDKDLEHAWVGLHKQEDTCNAGLNSDDLDCRRKGWSWQDRSEYTYPSWHDWADPEPKWNELCASLTTNRGWDGTRCQYEFPFLCEKGKQSICMHYFKQKK